MFETVESRLKELTDSGTKDDRRKEIYDELTEETTPIKQSTLGSVLGGLGLGALGIGLGAPAGKYGINKWLKTPETKKEFGEGIASTWMYDPIMKRLGEEMSDDIAANPQNAIKLTDDIGKSFGGAIASSLLGYYGGLYGGDWMGSKEPNLQADETLKMLADPNVPAEKKRALAALYQKHADAVENSQGSGIAQALTGAAVQAPLALMLNFGGGKRLGEMLVPDKRLDNSWIASSKGGRALMAETIGDAAVASPLGAAAGVAAYNATGSPYESPFENKDVNNVKRN